MLEDHRGYQRVCQDVLGRFANRPAPKNLFEALEFQHAATICFLRPDAGVDLKQATRLARSALAAAPDDAIMLTGLSAASIRNGEPDKAISLIHTALSKKWKLNLDWGGPVIAWLQLSLAHHQLGQTEEGRVWFNKAVQRIDGDPNLRATEATGIRWHLWALFEVMRQEAAQIYGSNGPES
jgi:hypothetical protein